MLLPEALARASATLAVKLIVHRRPSFLCPTRPPCRVASVPRSEDSVDLAKGICQDRLVPAVDDRRSRWAATASRVSSATRSALMAAPAITPALAEPRTCAVGSVTFPATHTPGTAVRP